MSIFYGAEWVWNDVVSKGRVEDLTTGNTSLTSSRYPTSQWYSWAVFASFQKNFKEELTIHAGARYNGFGLNSDFSSNAPFFPLPFTEAEFNQGALTGSVGVEWQPDDNWNFSAHGSTAFRSPNVDDVGKVFDSEPGAVVVPNAELRPEYAYTAEVDVARRIGKDLWVDVVAYYTYLDDALVRRPALLNGSDSVVYDGEQSQVQSIQNAAYAQVFGVEAKINWKITRSWSVDSRWTFQRGEEETDDGQISPSRHAAPSFGRTGITYQKNNLRIEFFSLYSDEVSFEDMPLTEIEKDHIYAEDSQGRPYSPAWATLNLRAMFEIIPGVDVTAGIDNILDSRYRPYSSGLVAPGRNYSIAIRLQGI
jgi:hemoglobin/transferrin/lactoferrin receptor protein